MNQRQTSDSDHDSSRRASGHDPSRVATEQRQSTDGPATHQRRISYPDPSRKTSDRRDGRATPNPSRQTSDRTATGQRQDSDRTATGQQHRLEQTNNGPATDEQSNGRRTEQRWTSDRKATDEQTGKEQTPPHQATSFPKPPLHASPTSRKHHTVSAISYPRNEQPVHLRTITFLNNHLHSSSTSTICAQSACSHLDLVLTQGA